MAKMLTHVGVEGLQILSLLHPTVEKMDAMRMTKVMDALRNPFLSYAGLFQKSTEPKVESASGKGFSILTGKEHLSPRHPGVHLGVILRKQFNKILGCDHDASSPAL